MIHFLFLRAAASLHHQRFIERVMVCCKSTITLVFIQILFCIQLFAQPTLVLSSDAEMGVLDSRHIFYRVVSATSSSTGEEFSPVSMRVPNFGFTADTIELKVNIDNKMRSSVCLFIENPNLTAFSVQAIPTSGVLFHVDTYDGGNTRYFPVAAGMHTFLIRLKSDSPLYAPVAIRTENQHYASVLDACIYQGMYAGFVISLILYNFFIFITLRDRTYFYYTFYTLLIGAHLLNLNGYTSILNVPEWLTKSNVLGPIGVCFGLCFVFSFFRVALQNNRWRFVGLYLIPLLLSSVVLTALSYFRLANIVFLVTATTAAVYALAVSIFCYFNYSYSPARYFALAWIAFVAGVLLYTLSSFSIIEHAIASPFIVQFSHGCETVLLSFALADKISFLRREKENAERQTTEQRIVINRILTEQDSLVRKAVTERTAALEAENRRKDKFFSIIAHDLRSPLNSIDGLISIVNSGVNLTNEELKTLMTQLGQSVKNAVILSNNLLTWARNQMQLNEPQKKILSISHVVEKSLEEAKVIAASKELVLKKVGQDFQIEADEDQMYFTIRNLVANAIKFTPRNGSVTIRMVQEKQESKIIIADTGIGIPSEMIPSLFELSSSKCRVGTTGEKGTGLGLILCKEFVDLNGGSIQVRSIESKGAEFTVIFPRKH